MPLLGNKVSHERLEEFRHVYRNVYGEEITVAEAAEMAHRLLALYRLLMQPVPEDVTATMPKRHSLSSRDVLCAVLGPDWTII
jgi:hypothetical protein